MGAREHNSNKTSAMNLPGLSAGARARVQDVEVHANEVLLQNIRAACQQFLEAMEVSPKPGTAKCVGRAPSLNALSRSVRDANIRAGRKLFGAVAAEYLPIDSDPEIYSERLMRVVLPFVLQKLETGRNDHLIEAAMSTELMEWETRLKIPTALPATLARQSPAEVIDQFRRQQGWTIEAVAAHAGVNIKQIYKIKRCEPVTTGTVARVAEALGCQPGDLIPATPPLKSQR
jgi:DNA-binding Xre family transcriptional regulator